MQQNPHYHMVASAIRWMTEHRADQPSLKQLADAMHVSPYHLQRTFQDWAGVSPKQFLKSLTRKAALKRLALGKSVLDTSLSVGLSGPGRLHDLLVTTEALTPGEARRRASGVSLEFGFGDSPFGEALIAWNRRGLSFLGFCLERGSEAALGELKAHWCNANFHENPDEARQWLQRIFGASHRQPLPIWLRGSPFQIKVWEALLAIPDGALLSYGDIAEQIAQPSAARAVGSAVGANPLAWLIPCHRVIRQQGDLGDYRWGSVTKRALVGFEAAGSPALPVDVRTAQLHERA